VASSTFQGLSEDADKDVEQFSTLEKLLDQVPASEGEIHGYLKTIRVVNFQGYLRLIDEEYLFRVFSLVTGCIEENSWSSDYVLKSVILSSISPLEPSFVLEKIFEWFFKIINESDDDVCSMQENEVCRLMGEVLLKSAGRFNLQEFLRIWQQTVPEGLTVNLKQLEGISVTNNLSSPPVIWHFPEYSLPEVITDRFTVLFEAKPKWELEEITPFLRNLPSCQSIGILLTKYARLNTVNGVKLYSSKHCK